jgi:hypothetical protein
MGLSVTGKNERAGERKPRQKKERSCEYCGWPFETTRTDAIYCSAACKQATYRKRKAGM